MNKFVRIFSLTLCIVIIFYSFVVSSSAVSRVYVLSQRTTDGDSTFWEPDSTISAGDLLFSQDLNEYAEQNGFQLVGYERVRSDTSSVSPVYYSFTSPDFPKSHYLVTLSYNLHMKAADGYYDPQSVSTYKPTSVDQSSYVYSYTVQSTVNSTITLQLTAAVWQYPSDMDYNTQIMILDYNPAWDPSMPSSVWYAFYFPIYAPKVAEDLDTAMAAADAIVSAIQNQTDEILNFDVSVAPSDEQQNIDSNIENMGDLEDNIYGSISQVTINDGGLIQDLLSDDYTGAFGVFNSVVNNITYGPIYTMIFFTLLIGCAMFILGKVVR